MSQRPSGPYFTDTDFVPRRVRAIEVSTTECALMWTTWQRTFYALTLVLSSSVQKNEKRQILETKVSSAKWINSLKCNRANFILTLPCSLFTTCLTGEF